MSDAFRTKATKDDNKKARKKQILSTIFFKGDLMSMFPFLALQTKGEIRFQKLPYVIVMLIARQGRGSLDISDSFIIVFQAFVLHIITEFHTICITHSGTCNFVVYITVIHGYLWQCAIHSLSAFDCMVSWEADCEPAPAFLIQRQLMHLQFWTWWFGSTGQGGKKISATD